MINGFMSGSVQTFYDRKSPSSIGPGNTVDLVVVGARLGNVSTVSRTSVTTGGIGVIGRLQSRSFGPHGDRGWFFKRVFALLGEEAFQQLVGLTLELLLRDRIVMYVPTVQPDALNPLCK
jgi:hypothetical protein